MMKQEDVQAILDAFSDPKKFPETWKNFNPETQILIGFTTILLPLLIVFLVHWCFAKKKRGDQILLLGPLNAGKTVIFFQLRDGRFVETHTSMKENEARFEINAKLDPRTNGNAAAAAPVHLVDFPGHPRVRYQLAARLAEARAIIFVIDAAELAADVRGPAEYLYDLMVDKTLRLRRKVPVLLVCNKMDLPAAVTKDIVQLKLEREIEQLRKTRAAAAVHSDDKGADDSVVAIGRADVPFELSHAPVDFILAESCASKGQLDEVVEFIKSISRR